MATHLLHFLLVAAIGPAAARAGEPLAKGIQDNSFLIEEAYNQEPGVVQHIFNLPSYFTGHAHEIMPSFTQEWPVFSQIHQFSYTIQYTFNNHANGPADIRLNYRLQALMEAERVPAFAPRLTLVLPTGNEQKGFSNGRVGYETNLPFSKILGNRWTVHFNAGMSIFPDVRGHDLINYNLGGSGIYAITRDFNLMLEMVAGWNEEVDFAVKTARANVNRITTALISPGFRYAFNCPNDLQIVAGAATRSVLLPIHQTGGCSFICPSNTRSCARAIGCDLSTSFVIIPGRCNGRGRWPRSQNTGHRGRFPMSTLPLRNPLAEVTGSGYNGLHHVFNQ
jgi:hypothetical protein